MGQAIFEFGFNRPSPRNTSPDKEEYGEIQVSINHALYFQERMYGFRNTSSSYIDPELVHLSRLSDP